MLFASNSNRKISTSLLDEIFGIEEEDTLVTSKHHELFQELEQLKIENSNKTIELLLEELQQNQQKGFDLYSLANHNYSLSDYQQTDHYQNIKLFRNEIKQVAIWLYDKDSSAMPSEVLKHFID